MLNCSEADSCEVSIHLINSLSNKKNDKNISHHLVPEKYIINLNVGKLVLFIAHFSDYKYHFSSVYGINQEQQHSDLSRICLHLYGSL